MPPPAASAFQAVPTGCETPYLALVRVGSRREGRGSGNPKALILLQNNRLEVSGTSPERRRGEGIFGEPISQVAFVSGVG